MTPNKAKDLDTLDTKIATSALTPRPSTLERGSSDEDAHREGDHRTVDVKADHASAVAARRRIKWMLVVAIIVGLTFRLWMATTTDNADARTLTWGSAFVAQGSTDPYKDVVEFSSGDPIPLGGIRSLSLAQGYVGVIVGAVPLWIGDQLDLIHLGSPPDGHDFRQGEIFAYKLSYLVPEFLLLAGIFMLLRKPRQRVLGTILWATSPLAFFAWGQGMPDVWTVAFLVWGAVLVDKAAHATTGASRARWLVAVIATVCVGGFGTKLLPAAWLLPVVVLTVRDGLMSRRTKAIVLTSIPVIFLIASAPYHISVFMETNVFERFEYDMLFSGAGIPVGSALYPAQWGLMILVGATVWFAVARDPWERAIPYMGVVILIISAMSGVITHLMLWGLAAVLFAVRKNPLGAVTVGFGFAVAAAWHVLSYDWLTGVFASAIDVNFDVGGTVEWLNGHIPMVRTLGGLVSSVLLLSALAMMSAWMFGWSRPVRLRHAAAAGAVGLTGFVVCLIGAAVIAADTGPAVWDFAYKAADTDDVIALPPGETWTSTPIDSDEVGNVITFKLHRSTQPSLDELDVALIDADGERVAGGTIPTWQAEPKSDMGPVAVRLDKNVELDGMRVAITRTGPSERVVEQDRQGLATVVNMPIVNIEADVNPNGILVPTVTVRHSFGGEMASALGRHLVEPQRLLGIPAIGLLLGLAYAFALRKLIPLNSDMPTDTDGSTVFEPVEDDTVLPDPDEAAPPWRIRLASWIAAGLDQGSGDSAERPAPQIPQPALAGSTTGGNR